MRTVHIIAFEKHPLSFDVFPLIETQHKKTFLLVVKKVYFNTMSLFSHDPPDKNEKRTAFARASAQRVAFAVNISLVWKER